MSLEVGRRRDGTKVEVDFRPSKNESIHATVTIIEVWTTDIDGNDVLDHLDVRLARHVAFLPIRVESA